jgi:hypothetical protein
MDNVFGDKSIVKNRKGLQMWFNNVANVQELFPI